jgi:hypothetical protein
MPTTVRKALREDTLLRQALARGPLFYQVGLNSHADTNTADAGRGVPTEEICPVALSGRGEG